MTEIKFVLKKLYFNAVNNKMEPFLYPQRGFGEVTKSRENQSQCFPDDNWFFTLPVPSTVSFYLF